MRELNGEDLLCYSIKIESVSLRKCPHGHRLTNEAHLSAFAVTNICHSFTYNVAAKINWHGYGTKLRHCHHRVYTRDLTSTARAECSQRRCGMSGTCRYFPARSSAALWPSMHFYTATVEL